MRDVLTNSALLYYMIFFSNIKFYIFFSFFLLKYFYSFIVHAETVFYKNPSNIISYLKDIVVSARLL